MDIHSSTSGEQSAPNSTENRNASTAVESSKTTSDSRNLPFSAPPSEKVLYEDVKSLRRMTYNFRGRGEAPVPTVVTDHRLKVKNNSYALGSVTSVKLESLLERVENSHWQQSKEFRRLFWAGLLFCILALCFKGYWVFLGGCIFTIGFAYAAARYKANDGITLRVVHTLIMEVAGKAVPVPIDVSMQYLSDDMVPQMVRAGYSVNQAPGWRQEYTEARDRAVAIADAVGRAIGKESSSIPK